MDNLLCDTPMSSCYLSQINWLWYTLTVLLVYILGGIWHSPLLFAKAWERLHPIQTASCNEPNKKQMLFVFTYQFLVTLLLTLIIFITVKESLTATILLTLGFCGWQKARLAFQYPKFNDLFLAASIEVGYLFLSAGIMIGMALL